MSPSNTLSLGRPTDLQLGSSDTRDAPVLVLSSLEAMSEWRTEWDRLWAAASDRTVFQHFAWAEAWVKSFGESGEMRVVVARDDGRPARARAILPMWVNDNGEFYLIGDPASDYQDLICDGDGDDIDSTLESMLVTLIQSRAGWSRIVFNELREDAVLLRALRRLAAADKLPFAWCEQTASRCPVVEAGHQNAVFEGFLKKKSLRRHYNRMSRMPGFQYRRLETPGESQVALNSLIDQHVARWAINGIPSLFTDKKNRDFYQNLIASPAFFSLMHFTVVEIDGHPVATHIGFLRDGNFLWYKPAFDPNYDRQSPGEVLMFCLFSEFAESGLKEFDFTRGEESFKSRFATAVRQSYKFTAFAGSLDQRAYSLLERLRDSEEKSGLIRLAAAILKPAGRIVRSIRRDVQNGGIKTVGIKLKNVLTAADRTVLVFRSGVTGDPPTAPDGLDITFGNIDLLALGKMSLLAPGYLSAARLQQAVTRKKRGDMILVIKDSGGTPVHFSWVRSEDIGNSREKGGGSPSVDTDKGSSTIYDSWTAPEEREGGLYCWATRHLANQIAREGRQAWLHCMSRDLFSRTEAERAGFVLQRRESVV